MHNIAVKLGQFAVFIWVASYDALSVTNGLNRGLVRGGHSIWKILYLLIFAFSWQDGYRIGFIIELAVNFMIEPLLVNVVECPIIFHVLQGEVDQLPKPRVSLTYTKGIRFIGECVSNNSQSRVLVSKVQKRGAISR